MHDHHQMLASINDASGSDAVKDHDMGDHNMGDHSGHSMMSMVVCILLSNAITHKVCNEFQMIFVFFISSSILDAKRSSYSINGEPKRLADLLDPY